MGLECGWRENRIEAPGHAMQLNGSPPRDRCCARGTEPQARRECRCPARNRAENRTGHGERPWAKGVGISAAQSGLPERLGRADLSGNRIADVQSLSEVARFP